MLEGLEISEVFLSQLEYSERLDSEYYRPECLKIEYLLKNKKHSNLGSIASFLIGPFGSAFSVANYTDEKIYRYIRGKDVKPMCLMDDDNVYMPSVDFHRLEKYALRQGDILISVVGTIGNAAIVELENLPAIFSCKSTVIRARHVDSHYLLTYLNSKFGNMLLKRKERGAVQMGLNLDDLKTLYIYMASPSFQETISKIYKKTIKINCDVKYTYKKSESLLLDAIGLTNFKPSTESITIKSLFDSFVTSGRLDAEYYQPKYEEMIMRIKAKNHAKLSDVVSIKKSIEPGSEAYTEDTDGLPFLRIADYSKHGIKKPHIRLSKVFTEKNQEKITAIKPQKGTILFSKDGSVGEAYCLREDADFITSGGILHFLLKDKNKILPDYLTLVLNSIVVQQQAERDVGGSIILHWRIEEIQNIVIPIVSYETQNKIAALVQESFSLKTKSEHLLEAAKRAVEIAIEQDETAAMAYLEKEGAL